MTAAIQQAARRERPILFSAPMVRALLAGTKTQTRRVVKPQPTAWRSSVPGMQDVGGLSWKGIDYEADSSADIETACPYGAPGDRLWVQEGYQLSGLFGAPDVECRYLADGDFRVVRLGVGETVKLKARSFPARSSPGRFMYRSLSRITLEVTEVRVQRLQDISEEDARAEGCEVDMHPERWTAYDPDTEGYPSFGVDPRTDPRNARFESVRHHPARPMPGASARRSFQRLWDSINGDGAWGANPWVWVVSFRRNEP